MSILQQLCLYTEENVLNIECEFKYHAVSSFAHFIECTAIQNINIGLMPLAMFSPAYLFQVIHDFSVLLFFSVLLLYIYCLIPFHYSFCFNFSLLPYFAASLHLYLFIFIFMLLFIAV